MGAYLSSEITQRVTLGGPYLPGGKTLGPTIRRGLQWNYRGTYTGEGLTYYAELQRDYNFGVNNLSCGITQD